MNRLLSIGLAVAIVVGASSVALAQRDIGAKFRGEFGQGFWNSSAQTSRPTAYYQPAQPAPESYRTYSYEPLGINTGDEMVVTTDSAKLMSGRSVVGTLKKGVEFRVTGVANGWLGAEIKLEGNTFKGWIWNTEVAHQKPAEPAPAPAATNS